MATLKKFTDLITKTTPSGTDILAIVDVSDTTDSAQGTSKQVTVASQKSAMVTAGLVDTNTSQTLTNKEINLASNTLTGTTAQFNTALSDNDFATQAGSETLTNKTISTGSKLDADADPNFTYYGIARQAIINGNFVINQRGYVSNATLAAGAYGHDRWKAGASGGDYTFTQLANSTTITIKTGKTLIQVIEDKNVVGGTYTLSWTGTAQARFGKDSATPSGSYSASPITITGQTAGTVMSVEFNEGTLSNVQMNSGSVALPYQPKSFNDELQSCMRYYQKSFKNSVAPAQATNDYNGALGATSGTNLADAGVATVFLKTPMRSTTPTITTYNPARSNTSWVNTNDNVDVVAGAGGASESSFQITFTGAPNANRKHFIHWTIEAEL